MRYGLGQPATIAAAPPRSGARTTAASALIVAAQFGIVFTSAMLPTPLYPLYRHAFGFSGVILTLVYAVYVLGNVAALLIFGRLADQIGRRKVALPAIGVALASAIVFLLARDTAWLFVGRLLSGFATGLSAGAAAAWLAELFPPEQRGKAAILATGGNFLGLAFGPLFAGLLATCSPWPLRLPYLLYVFLLLAAAVVVRAVPETVTNPKRWSEVSLAPRLGVPADIRLAFVSPAMTAFATFSMIGFYGALVPGLVAESLHATSPLVSGAVVCELFTVATVTLALSTRMKPVIAMLAALVLLPVSVGLLVIAEANHSMWVMTVAAAVGGAAAAFGYRGSLQVVNAIAPAQRRSEVVSAYLLAPFAGNSIPVIGIAVLAVATSPATAHLVFAGVISLFATIAFGFGMRTAGRLLQS